MGWTRLGEAPTTFDSNRKGVTDEGGGKRRCNVLAELILDINEAMTHMSHVVADD